MKLRYNCEYQQSDNLKKYLPTHSCSLKAKQNKY